MNPLRKQSALVAKRLFQVSLICLAVIFFVKVVLVPSSAQSSEERELEDKVPKHLPIKVKIKKEKEKAFKDLKNEKWVRDFELEITNAGDKPIYFLSLLLILPGITAPDGNEIGFAIHYGRSALGDIGTKAEPDDVPINPGETYVFRFPDNKLIDWERFRHREDKPDPKKLSLRFQILSFGDGTGFVGSNGLALPRPPNERSSLERCEPAPGLNDSGGVKLQPAIFLIDDLPAQFLLANFLSPETSHLASLNLTPQSQLC